MNYTALLMQLRVCWIEYRALLIESLVHFILNRACFVQNNHKMRNLTYSA